MANQVQTNKRSGKEKPVSRRQLLKASGAAALATGIAGCQGGNTAGSNDGSTSDETLLESRFDGVTNTQPINTHFNPYNPTQAASVISSLQNHLWKYNGRTFEWHPRISDKFSYDGTTVTIEIDPSYKWADGKPVTATDVEMQFQIEKGLKLPIWDYLTSVQKKGKRTVEFQLKKSYNRNVFRSNLNRYITVKRGSAWEQWVDRFNDAAGNEDRRQQVVNDLRTWSYASDSGDPVTNGPLILEDRSSSRYVLTPNKHFPYKTNIKKYAFHAITSDQQMWQRAISDELDGTHHFSVTKSTLKKWPDHIKHYYVPRLECSCPAFNLTRTPWGKREARQAIAYLLDRKLLVENRNPRHSLLHQSTGLPDKIAKKLLPERRIDQMGQYGIESKPQKAAERMRAAGLQKQGGKWRTAKGLPVSLEWMGATWPDSKGMAQTLEQLLPDFGIEFTGTIVSTPEWVSRRSKGQFGLTHAIISTGAAKPSPWLAFAGVVNSPPLNKHAGHPKKTVKLSPIGNPDGSLQPINLQKMLQKMLTTNNENKLQKLTAQATWYINQFVPRLPSSNAAYSATVSTDHWTFPPIDSDVMGMTNPHHQLLREPQKDDPNKAVLQAKTK